MYEKKNFKEKIKKVMTYDRQHLINVYLRLLCKK